MKTIKNSMLLVIFCLLSVLNVHAQDEELTLNFSRDWGYSSGSGKIQGVFSMKVTSSVSLTQVTFYIDSLEIGKADKEPYKIQFNTDDYPAGIHTMYAIGVTSDGRELKTKKVKTEFISAEESNKAALSILGPILGLALIIVVVSAIVPVLTSRKNSPLQAGTQRNYGIAGGTICPKCKRPFARHILAPNMFLGKLERCPHCGKWCVARLYSIDLLREAEKAELINPIKRDDDSDNSLGDDNFKNEIDNSKYQGL
jgi:hypothetical protein